MNDDQAYHHPQRVTITFDLDHGIGTNTVAVRALLSMLERLEDAGLHPRAASLQLGIIPAT